MKLVLKEFQEIALDKLLTEITLARHEISVASKPQALALSSPTGSGKTVIMTDLIEKLLEGHGQYAPDPQATFLWITDQPELNEQTLGKMSENSTRLWMGGLEVVSSAFDKERFDPGKVYFLNTQKLGKDKNLIQPSDSRTFTIWETISNTATDRPESFYVIIDEAHRGMRESATARKQAATIVQKFIKGSDGEIPPIPMIVGVSATPERFQNLIGGTNRTARIVDVPPEDVRASGLLKETITLWHPKENQPGDTTMLRSAAEQWKTYCRRWAAYCELESEPVVRPILVVQVQDGSKSSISSTDIESAIDAINEEVGPLPAGAFAHSFEEHQTLEVGKHNLRYLAPSSIDSDPHIQVVFFKTSLNTGWDCPRAEVMMSFRKAKDATLIAQLVGRMVRTPLARPVSGDHSLNTVGLFLPHYDEAGLDKVIDYLTAPDADVLGPVGIEKAGNLVEVSRDPGLTACFLALEAVPTYLVPKALRTSEIRRLMKLARQLSNCGIEPDAPETAKAELTDLIGASLTAIKDSAGFQAACADVLSLDVQAREHSLVDGENVFSEAQLSVSAGNVKDLFEATGRNLGEGIHKDFLQRRCQEGVDAQSARVELIAVLRSDANLHKSLESHARNKTLNWFSEHSTAMKSLIDSDRQEFWHIRGMATHPELANISNLPTTFSTAVSDQCWGQHLYTDENGKFQAELNGWETLVIQQELDRDDFVGWLRNPPRKDWSICVPYHKGGVTYPMYPDFLIFREVAGDIVVDILDPHAESLADAVAKARGMASFAEHHLMEFGRIELISVKNNQVRRLSLADDETRSAVLDVATPSQLAKLFDSVSAES